MVTRHACLTASGGEGQNKTAEKLPSMSIASIPGTLSSSKVRTTYIESPHPTASPVCDVEAFFKRKEATHTAKLGLKT